MLREEIKIGEGKKLEFKEKLPTNNSIAKTIIAFSNTVGGKLIIGVNDKREIIGIDGDIFGLQDKIISIIYESCSPIIMPEIYTKNIDGKILLIIEVFRGNTMPYYIKSLGKERGTYIRIGATNRLASREKVLELEWQQKNISFDELINYEYNLENIDLEVIRKNFSNIKKELTKEKMKSLKIIKEENGNEYPTNGLLILLGIFENEVIKCSRFKGKDKLVFLDKKEYSGDLFSQLEQAELFIKNYINLESEIKGLQRTDKYEIPEEALREALVNAVVHRDYINLGRDIKVAVYDDRIEIVSPGSLPNGVSNEEMQNGRSEVRNRVIARVFKELNYIEQWGSGIYRIKKSCTNDGLKEPFIEGTDNFVGVRIYRKNTKPAEKTGGKNEKPAEKTGGKNEKPAEKTGGKNEKPAEKKILQYLEENKVIKRKNVEELIGVKQSRAREILEKMTKKNLISKEGQGRATYYKIKERTIFSL